MINTTAPLVEKTIKKFLLRLWRDERGEAGEEQDPEPVAADPPPDSPPGPATPAADPDPDPPPDSPFLKVNDRTTYDTAEAAIEGFGKASERIQEYSQHGTPQEIADRLVELDNIKKVAAGQPAGGEPDPYKGMDDKEKAQWQAFESEDKGKAALRRMGYVSRDEVRQEIQDTLERDRKFGEAGKHFVEQSNVRGIPMGPDALEDFEHRGGNFYAKNSQAKTLWDNNDTKGFVDLFFLKTHGEASSSPSPPGNPAPERGADGKFIAKAAQYEQAKQAAKGLPKAPPNGSAAPTRSADELSLEDRRDPQKRLLRVRKHFEDITSSAGV